jgi:hypothetical protein
MNSSGRRVLVVEDEVMVSWVLEDTLVDLGCEIVGPAARVAGCDADGRKDPGRIWPKGLPPPGIWHFGALKNPGVLPLIVPRCVGLPPP